MSASTTTPAGLWPPTRRFSERTDGRLGIRVCADLSHYVHQIGNSHFPQWPSISTGALRLDPFDPDNYVSGNIIEKGMVWGGHLRAAMPNDLPPGQGSIQYPIVDPKTDPETAGLQNGGMKEPWDVTKLRHWKEFYRQLFTYQLQHPEHPVARFASEFIGDGGAGDYRVEPYSNVFQNIAAVCDSPAQDPGNQGRPGRLDRRPPRKPACQGSRLRLKVGPAPQLVNALQPEL